MLRGSYVENGDHAYVARLSLSEGPAPDHVEIDDSAVSVQRAFQEGRRRPRSDRRRRTQARPRRLFQLGEAAGPHVPRRHDVGRPGHAPGRPGCARPIRPGRRAGRRSGHRQVRAHHRGRNSSSTQTASSRRSSATGGKRHDHVPSGRRAPLQASSDLSFRTGPAALTMIASAHDAWDAPTASL